MNTIWLPIAEFKNYFISPEGGVLSTAISHGRKGVPRILKPVIDKQGYSRIKIWHNGKYHVRKIHRLVASVCIEKKSKNLVVNHINCIRHDNRVENLEWASIAENNRHRDLMGRHKPMFGDKNPASKITDKQEQEMFELRKQGKKLKELSLIYSISMSAISNRLRKK
jgi:hypothetical protein